MPKLLATLPLSPSMGVLLAALSSGCVTRGPHVRAVVGAALEPSRTASDGRAASPRPLAGASVSMHCPQALKAASKSLLGRTDARGELDFEEPPFGRWIHDGCELIVESPGYRTRRISVAEVCVEYSANHCVRAVFTTELQPSS